MSDAIPLPPRPKLDQYKKLAGDFQTACKSSEKGAIRRCAARWLEALAQLQGSEITSEVRRRIEQESERIEQRWHKLAESTGRLTRCTLAGAQFFVAREHGFASWPKLSRHVEALAHAKSPVSNFEAAADAIAGGDAAALKRLLREDPQLVRARSSREHRSTLLHYVSANGIEDFRQKTPTNIVEITEMLIKAGADVNAESDAYGGGSTTLGLVATSIHPEQAGVQIELLQTLLKHGARIDQPSAAGNGHSVVTGCLANGQPQAAEFLAGRGAPVDLEGAAGLGGLSTVKSYFTENAKPQPGVSRRQIESAYEYACSYGRLEVVNFLMNAGIDAGWRNADGQTGLHCAAYGAHVDLMKLLLERGLPVDVKDKNFQATPLDVALWVWQNSQDPARRERCYDVVRLLARAGAKLDPQQWAQPGADAPGMLDKIEADPRMTEALSGGS